MTDKQVILQGIKSCKLFQDFSDKEIHEIAELAIVRDFKAGDNIFTIKHKDEFFFLVYDGLLSLRLRTRKSRKYGRGEIFGEVSIFSDKLRSGNIRAVKDSKLIAFDSHKIFKKNIIDYSTKYKLIRQLTEMIISYLYEDESISSQELIERGEGSTTEFKKSLNPKDKEFKKKIVQTIASLMNSKGGYILIGVDDDSEVVGLKNHNSTIEKFMNSIIDIIDDRIGGNSSSLIDFDIDEVKSKKILRIEVAKSMAPIAIRENNNEECIYTRKGASNRKIKNPLNIIRFYEKNFKY